jgi:hypothetical protein
MIGAINQGDSRWCVFESLGRSQSAETSADDYNMLNAR